MAIQFTNGFTLTKNPPPPPTYTLGASIGGGKVAYIYVDGDPGYSSTEQHGIILQTTDFSGAGTKHVYGGRGTSVTNASSTAVGQGYNNTINFNNTLGGTTSAPYKAVSNTSGGYSDWFIPSNDEWSKIYIGRATHGLFTAGLNYYWSSTTTDASNFQNVYTNYNNSFLAYTFRDNPQVIRLARYF